MDKERLLVMTDIFEQISGGMVIDSKLVESNDIVLNFLKVSQDTPMVQFNFLRQCSVPDQVRLTHADIFQEELFLKFHRSIGFSIPELSQWLRGLDYLSYSYFVDQCKQHEIQNVDIIVDQATSSYEHVGTVFVESKSVGFNNIMTLISYVLLKRISFKEFYYGLSQFQLDDQLYTQVCDYFTIKQQALKPLTSADQVLLFRAFSGLMDQFDTKQDYDDPIFKVVYQLLTDTSVEKCMGFVNTLPYRLMRMIIANFIKEDFRPVINHLNQVLPLFQYGHIRKIVRRYSLELQY